MAHEPLSDPAADLPDGWDDGAAGLLTDVTGPRWREPKVRRAFVGLVFVIGIFVIAPVAAMLAAAH